MRLGRRGMIAAAGVAGVLALLLVASAVSGTSPQRLVSNAIGGGHPVSGGTHQPACCSEELPCPEGLSSQLSSYCCWCGCPAGSPLRNGTSPQVLFCPMEGNLLYCGRCPPPPCTGICPMGPPPAAAP